MGISAWALGLALGVVRHVNSVHGLTQPVNCYYYLQLMAMQAAKMSGISRIEAFVNRYRCQNVNFINTASLILRATSVIFNIERPQSAKKWFSLVEKVGIEFFPICREYFSQSGMVSDLYLGIPILAKSVFNIIDGKSFDDRRLDDIKDLEKEILELEVCVEYSRDLQRLQRLQLVADRRQKSQQILAEFKDLAVLISSPEGLQEEITALKQLDEMIGSSPHVKQGKLLALKSKKDNLEEAGADQIERDAIAWSIREIELSQEVDPKIFEKEISALEETVSALRQKRDELESTGGTNFELAKKAFKNKWRALKNLRCISKALDIKDEKDYFDRFNEHPSKISLKSVALARFAKFTEDNFFNATEFGQQVMLLREENRANARQLLAADSLGSKGVKKKLKIKKELSEKLSRLSIVGPFEAINTKLIYCDQIVNKFKEKLGTNAETALAGNTEIDSELQFTKELIEQLAVSFGSSIYSDRVTELNKKSGEYFLAVQNILKQKTIQKADPAFAGVRRELEGVEEVIQSLRKEIQEKRNDLLKFIREEKKTFETKGEWRKIFSRYTSPLTKLILGTAIVGIRVLKLLGMMSSNTRVDFIADVAILGSLAVRIGFRVLISKPEKELNYGQVIFKKYSAV